MSILQMSLSASAMIVFTMLLRKLALNRLPKRTFVALWLLAAARMLLPWELPFRYAASPVIRDVAESALRTAAPVAITAAQRTFAPVAAAVDAVQAAPVPIWRIVWLAGLIACGLALTLPHLRWRRVYARSLPAADANIADWLQDQKLLRRVRVRISDEIPSPLTCGLLRPMILLPTSLNRSDAQGLEYVLAHELTHIRRMDALWKLLLAAALCAHWFNPLAWAMYLLANRDIELACDEAVLRRFGEGTRREYARTLIDLAARQSGLPSPLFSGFSRQTIEERIRAIMKMKKRTMIAALAAVLLVTFSALAFATTASTKPARVIDAEIEELMFDGYEDMSVREYKAWLDNTGIDPTFFEPPLGESVEYDSSYCDFIDYVLAALSEPNWEEDTAYLYSGFPAPFSDPNDAPIQFRAIRKITDADHLTVGHLRDASKAVAEGMWEGIANMPPQEATQAQLNELAWELEETWSDGSTILFQIDVEIVGPDSPYTDSETAALLETYAPLGLEYYFNFGELSMFYRGNSVNGLRDAEREIVIANSTGPKGLGGGSVLEAIYRDGKPAELRFIEN